MSKPAPPSGTVGGEGSVLFPSRAAHVCINAPFFLILWETDLATCLFGFESGSFRTLTFGIRTLRGGIAHRGGSPLSGAVQAPAPSSWQGLYVQGWIPFEVTLKATENSKRHILSLE